VRSGAALLSSFTSLFRGELMCVAAFVRGATTLGGDLALPLRIHSFEAAVVGLLIFTLIVCHFYISWIE
jgi:hypothetical protein